MARELQTLDAQRMDGTLVPSYAKATSNELHVGRKGKLF